MNTKHTPGPWKYDRYGYIESPSTGLPICSMQPAGNLEAKARQRANAALIAAAPDMLAALREAWNVLCYAAQESEGKVRKEIVGGWIHHAAIINAIVVKAEGKS
jgi:hypothetical protein